MNIRSIRKKDNPEVAVIIRKTLREFGAPETGTVLEDSSVDCMFETYQKPKSLYLVVENDQKIIGGAGIAPLDGTNGSLCELQKMYVLPQGRNRGIGGQLMQLCLDFALEKDFSACYLETFPGMKAAQKLYKKYGFAKIDERLGKTGHHACHVWMLKKL